MQCSDKRAALWIFFNSSEKSWFLSEVLMSCSRGLMRGLKYSNFNSEPKVGFKE